MRLRPTQIMSANPKIDGELRYEKSRQALPGVVERKSRQPDVAAAGDADEAIAQSLVLEQHEYQHDEHDPRGLDRNPDRPDHLFDDLQAIRRGFVQLHRDRRRGHGGIRLIERARLFGRCRLLGAGAAVRQPPQRPGESIELAYGKGVHGPQLAFDRAFVVRQTRGHAHELRADDAGHCGK